MRKLVVHCGLHKTGSSAIQDFLFDNAQLINNSKNYKLFSENKKGSVQSRNLSSWVDHSSVNQSSARVHKEFYTSLLASAENNKTLIVSSEAFSWLLEDNEVMSFYDNLKTIFDEIKVIFYLRRQDKLALSHFSQRAKAYHREGTFYSTTEKNFLPYMDSNAKKYFDYNNRINLFCNNFGEENIIVRIFDKADLKNGDVVEDFKGLLQLDIPHKKKLQNKAFGFEQVKFHEELIKRHIPQSSLLWKVATNINSTRKVSCNKSEAFNFYMQFDGGNKELNKRLKISSTPNLFDMDFSNYPLVYDFNWKVTDINKIIDSSIASINHYDYILSPKVIDLIRDSAVLLEKNDLKKALELMELAKKLRPNGSFINSKVNTYKKIINEADL